MMDGLASNHELYVQKKELEEKVSNLGATLELNLSAYIISELNKKRDFELDVASPQWKSFEKNLLSKVDRQTNQELQSLIQTQDTVRLKKVIKLKSGISKWNFS
jgi:hypothetical protein